MTSDPILDFWNDRARLKSQAGSNDIVAKTLEIEELIKQLSDGLEVAEFGCGNGVTAVELAGRFDLRIRAFDFSSEMIKEAKGHAEQSGLEGRVSFDVADIRNPPRLEPCFDAVYTERMLINLPDWYTQARAIQYMTTCLKPGGRLLLCENSQQGLAALNELRHMVGLENIAQPWHNVYLDDSKMASMSIPGCDLRDVIPYSATYYFLSRVVNAWLAKQEGVSPSYDAPVNRLAALLPSFGGCSQGKLWIIQKRD